MATLTETSFSDAARACRMNARSEAHLLRHKYVGSEDLLLTLMKQNDRLVSGVLTNNGITLVKVENEIKKVVQECSNPPHIVSLKFSQKAHAVIQAGIAQADMSGSDIVEPIHLLLGILITPACVAHAIITNLGGNIETMCKEAVQAMEDGFVTPKPPYGDRFKKLKLLLGDPQMTDEKALDAAIAIVEEHYKH